jgi:hypothetical protein
MTLSDYGYRKPFYHCSSCSRNIPAEDYERHRTRDHDIDRPEPDAMRTSEVAAILGISTRTVLYKVRMGKIKSLPRPHGRGNPIWIGGAALKHYINQQAKKTDVAVRWAATGVLDG